MTQKRLIILLIGILALAAVAWYRTRVLGEPAPGGKSRLVVVTGGSGPYWQEIGKGAQAAAKDLDVDLDLQMPADDENLQMQMDILSRLTLDNVDGVALSPLDAEAQTRIINQMAGKAFIVTIDSDAPLSMRLSYVGASNRAAGGSCAQLVQEAVPQGGKVAVLMANLTKNNMQERKIGFEEVFSPEEIKTDDAAATWEIVDYLVDEGDRERCERQLRELLAANEDLDCLVGMNAQHGPILIGVLRDEDLLGKIKLVTFDTVEETLEGIEQGHIFATVAQDAYQYGYEAVRLLDSYCRRDAKQLPPPGVQSSMNISTKPVRRDNVAEFRASSHRGTNSGDAE